MKEQLLSLSLLIIMVFQSLFSDLFYELGRYQCQYNFAQSTDKISDLEIQTFIFLKDWEIDWEKENKEFSLNGQLYDVVKIESNSSTTVIKCKLDSKETGLVHSYLRSLKDSEKDGPEQYVHGKFHIIKYFTAKSPFVLIGDELKNEVLNKNENSFLTIFMEIISPPPKNLFLFHIV